jgi:redox-sensitive bicupin YhaK (pirin superfamily)
MKNGDAAASGANGSVAVVVVPRTHDLGGGFNVRRALPAVERRAVGPFVFLDQMGPTVFASNQSLDVRPHPHIGLATITYLFAGRIVHRDSLGTIQTIEPGDVNWMTAGRGIVHSERSAPEDKATERAMSGIQMWVALPLSQEESAPAFAHHPAASLPTVNEYGVSVRIIAGSLYGKRSPVAISSELVYAEAALGPDGSLSIPAEHEERAAYVVSGQLMADGRLFDAGRLLVLAPGRVCVLRALSPSRVLILGGDALDAPRHVWWNFVSSSRDRIEAAKVEWRERRFGVTVPGDEQEFIPLPP